MIISNPLSSEQLGTNPRVSADQAVAPATFHHEGPAPFTEISDLSVPRPRAPQWLVRPTVGQSLAPNIEESRLVLQQPSDEQSNSLSMFPSKRRRTHSTPVTHNREIGLMRNSDGQGPATFVGSASGIHFIRSVYGAVAQKSQQPDTETPGSSTVPGEEDRLQPELNAYRSLWYSDEVSTGISQASCDDMITWSHNYIQNWHPLFPFIHASSIHKHIRSISAGLKDPRKLELIILRSIISMSIADNRQTNIRHQTLIPDWLVFVSFADALDSIQPIISSPASILSLQAALCVQLFLVTMLRHNAASRLGGLIVRMCFQLGLHRCPARFPSFQEDEVQLRRHLFWSIYCIDRHLSQALGLPLGIRDDDVDVCYPTEEHHEHEKNNAFGT